LNWMMVAESLREELCFVSFLSGRVVKTTADFHLQRFRTDHVDAVPYWENPIHTGMIKLISVVKCEVSSRWNLPPETLSRHEGGQVALRHCVTTIFGLVDIRQRYINYGGYVVWNGARRYLQWMLTDDLVS
jgi:hypothetical protein